MSPFVRSLFFLALALFVLGGQAITSNEQTAIDALNATCGGLAPWNRSDPCAYTSVFTCVSGAIKEIDYTYSKCAITHIPTQLGLLTGLTSLQLSPQMGPIPTEFAALTALTTFKLLGNATYTILGNLTTVNASIFANWAHIKFFYINYANLTNAPISELVEIFRDSDGNVKVLDLGYNKLANTAASITGLNLTDFEMTLVLNNNRIGGDLSESVFEGNNGAALSLSNNLITGPVAPCITQFEKVFLDHNLLSELGDIQSTAVGEVAGITILDVSNNRLVGTIPAGFYVPSFYAANNRLVGSVPTSLTGESLMFTLDLSNNTLSGPFNFTSTPDDTTILKIVQDGTTLCPVNNLTAYLVLNTDENEESSTDYDTYLEAGACAPCGGEANETWSPTCSGSGLCVAGNDSDYTCSCYNGTSGYYCQAEACSADPVPCGDHGTCTPQNFAAPFYICVCDVNYHGDECTTHTPILTDKQVIVSMTAFVVFGAGITFMLPAGIIKLGFF